jgi:hypothetical protein
MEKEEIIKGYEKANEWTPVADFKHEQFKDYIVYCLIGEKSLVTVAQCHGDGWPDRKGEVWYSEKEDCEIKVTHCKNFPLPPKK